MFRAKPLGSRTKAERLATNGDSRSEQNAPSSQVASDELKRLVYRATCQISSHQRIHASRVGALLREHDSNFSYEKYGFTKLIDLLQSVPDLVALEKVERTEKSQTAQVNQLSRRLAPVYYVRSRSDTTALIKQSLRSFESADSNSADPTWVHRQSLEAAIAQQAPTFAVSKYGFRSLQALLESREDLVERKSDAPDYVRLRDAKPKDVKPKDSKTQNIGSKDRARSPLVRPIIKAKTTLVRPNLRSDKTQTIESLLKSTGLSVDALQEKVSELAAIALPEAWYFGPQPPETFSYPILKSYLRYTFVRLQYESKVLTSSSQQYRAFNTGLLDTLLRPVHALLTRTQQPGKWALDFCIAGEDYTGKTLVSEFAQLPVAANYFENADKAFYYLGAGAPTVDWQHVVKDNMARLPLAFLERYAPAGFIPRSTQAMSTPTFYTYKRSFTTALDADPSSYRAIVSRLEEALEKTLRRTQVNYTTAVPTYYPKINSVDLLLPMCLVNEHIVDLALVVRREPSGQYIGHTILTLRQAYNNARLICKLDNHWLPRAMTLSQEASQETSQEAGQETSQEAGQETT